jgi:putative Holliday junction resolvase
VSPLLPDGRALGLDLGERRIGVAVSDSDRTLAVPLCTIDRTGSRVSEHRNIVDLVEEWAIKVVVVGLPISLDGTIGPAAQSAQSEAEELSVVLGPSRVDVVTHDERFTTVEAHRALANTGKSARARRKTVDQSAAAVMLQAWLTSRAGSAAHG